WPQFAPEQIAAMRGQPYAEIAFQVMRPYVGGTIPDDALRAMINEAYGTFAHASVAPLVQIGPSDWLMELFHGPTLAFKDVAMQLLSRMMDRALVNRGQRATVVVATSGDTGGAAVDGFAGRDAIDLFVLFPRGRVSDVQRRQMTTRGAGNVHAIAVEGTFDDCQAIVKALFNDQPTRDALALSGVNSINWARVMAQSVYYFSTGAALGAPDVAAHYCVPTANFGDILAGYVAKRMGLPMGRLIIAANTNDILARALETGAYEVTGVIPTQTPSMDIQVSSNFERLIFEASDRDAGLVRTLMADLKAGNGFTLPGEVLERILSEFDAGRCHEAETTAQITRTYRETGEVLDPHTAVGVHVAEKLKERGDLARGPMVTLATAHPAKFPAAVEAAIGQPPQLPVRVGDLHARPEAFAVLDNDYSAVRDHLFQTSRACNMAQ
ncbi:MAG: threonine synthase, partial [Pseudomonadota bacterium]